MLNPNRSALENPFEPLHIVPPEVSLEAHPSRWVRVAELAEGGFTADFRFMCAGIIRAHPETEKDMAGKMSVRQDQLMRSILAVLNEGDSLEFHFHGGGAEQLQWEIGGRACRETAEQAVQSAEALLPSFHTLTSAIEEQYRFEPKPLERSSTSEPLAFRSILKADTTTIVLPGARGVLGFANSATPADPPPTKIIFPVFRTKRSFAFPSLAALIAGSSIPLSCAVRLTPFFLTGLESQWVKTAMDHVISTLAGGNDSSEKTAGPEMSLHGCREALALWAASGGGYRIHAELSSPVPLPAGLRGLITNDLFPHHSASKPQPVSIPCRVPGKNLDLSNGIPMRGILPVLFPDAKTLERHDLTQIFNRKRPKLPVTGLRLGRIEEAGLNMEIHADSAFRDRHTYIMGATGTGKSTLLFNGILQDIMAGNGICLIDPHGDLYEQVLHSIPRSRSKDVILLNPCETDDVPGINFLEVSSGKTRTFEVNYAINELVKMLDRLYDMRLVGGPMFESYFRNALLLLIDSSLHGHTLAELATVFEDREFRNHLKKHCTNPYAVNFWTQQAEKTSGDSSLQNMAPYITSKLNLLVQSAILRPIIGQSRSTINFREVMDRRQILLVNLSKGKLGELDMQLLGMIIIGKLFSSAMGRASVRPEKRIPFHLYIDEFQNFTTDTAASLLSEARKFQLCLTLANQNLAQLNTSTGKQNLLEAILGNVGNFILFRLGAPDAAKMEVYTRPHFNYETLQNLPNYHALARLQTGDGPSIPFVFKTELPAVISQPRSVLSAIHQRQSRYRLPRELVEKRILERQSVKNSS